MNKFEINENTLKALDNFCYIKSKAEMLDNIEQIIKLNVITGNVREFEMEDEMALLFEVKRLIEALPIPE